MRNVTGKMLSGVLVAGLSVSALAGIAFAEEEKPTADLTVSALSQYIWRGFELSKDSMVIQPSMTVGYKGFSANLWGNLDTDPYAATDESNNFNETDLTLAYGWDMGPMSFSAGYIYYALDAADDSQEFFVSAAANVFLTPTLAVYRDTDSFPGWYTTLGISHSFPVQGDITLDLGAQVSYLSADEASTIADPDDANDNYSNFHDGILSLGLTVPVNKYITINPKLSYTFALSNDARDVMKAGSKDGDDSDFIYGGVSVSMAF